MTYERGATPQSSVTPQQIKYLSYLQGQIRKEAFKLEKQRGPVEYVR